MKKLLLSFGLLLALSVRVFAATPLEVVEITSINAPPMKVWETVSIFSALDWNPEVVDVDVIGDAAIKPGTVRVLTLKNGKKIKERLVSIQPEQMVLTFEVIESDLPVQQQSETITVAEKDKTAIVTWQGKFVSDNPQDARAAADAIQKLYKTGLAHLKTKLEAKK
jgi:hypothetical protein